MLCSPASPYHKDELTTADDQSRNLRVAGIARFSSRHAPLTLAPVARLVKEMSVGSAVSVEAIAWRDRARAFAFVSIARECAR